MNEYTQVYSTAISIDVCANGEYLQWESVLNSPVADVYTYLDYRAAKSHAEEVEFEWKQKQNR